MKYTFVLATQAFSVNAYRYRKNFIKTKEAREYEEKILYMLDEHKQLHDMADMWRKTGGYFEISIVQTYPKHIFYNQAGTISSKTFDISNCEKPLLDLILNTFMSVDDKNVTKLISEKRIGLNYTIEVSLELIPAA